MGVYIPNIKKPKSCFTCNNIGIRELVSCKVYSETGENICPLVEIPTPHGRLIDADEFRQAMYHESFETDSDLQKWDSGCWIRYKMFEKHIESAPTVIEVEE